MREPALISPEQRSTQPPPIGVLDPVRFEVLPIERSVEQAAELPEPVRMTVTCSPRHGPDRSVDVAARLRALGHAVTVHVAARMVRDRDHLDALLTAMAQAGLDDLFLIGGDADPQKGEYSSAVELLAPVSEHPVRPQAIGIAGYPEGHPLISDRVLEEALYEKSRRADYVTTQMCFDGSVLRRWVSDQRERGMEIPVLIGLPGKVARHRLLEMSVRIGIGPSLAFVRKHRGLRSIVSRRSSADRLYDELEPVLADRSLNVAGFHFYTFNQLLDTWRWQRANRARSARRAQGEI